MRILHYLPGLPPVRTGGMIKYALDLIEAQKENHEVCILTAGPISIRKEKRNAVGIKYAGRVKEIRKYEIRNALPIPMANGILDVDWYTLPVDEGVYLRFLKKMTPDVIHVHSFMGLHIEFLRAAKKCGIPVAYTTHDYFGLCPKTDMMYGKKVCDQCGIQCEICCQDAFSEKRILLEHSHPYRWYRKSNVLIQLLKNGWLHKAGASYRSHVPDIETERDTIRVKQNVDYKKLFGYYRDMFALVSFFHFNSGLARQVYENLLGNLSGEEIPISNKSIADHRKKRVCAQPVRVGFVGGNSPYKGFKQLHQMIEELRAEGIKDLELHAYGNFEKQEYEDVIYHGIYKVEEIGQVYDTIDILAVPSIWNETFGMVVLEALSYGIPVMTKENVGAADLIRKAEKPIGWVVADDAAYKAELGKIAEDHGLVQERNQNIVEADLSFAYEEHVRQMELLYQKVIGNKG